MGRKRKFTADQLTIARNAIQGGKSQSEAARLSGVSRRTIQNRLKSSDWTQMKFGKPCVLTPSQERELYVYAIDCMKGGNFLPIDMLIDSARYILATENPDEKVNVPDLKNKWLRGFLSRHKSLVRRTPQEQYKVLKT